MNGGAPSVYMIESPEPEDLVEDRCEGGILGKALSIAGIRHTYSLAVSGSMFVHCTTDQLPYCWANCVSSGIACSAFKAVPDG